MQYEVEPINQTDENAQNLYESFKRATSHRTHRRIVTLSFFKKSTVPGILLISSHNVVLNITYQEKKSGSWDILNLSQNKGIFSKF